MPLIDVIGIWGDPCACETIMWFIAAPGGILINIPGLADIIAATFAVN
jgi:hypothetical protein